MPDGCLIAFDAEFVSVEVENVVMDSTGQRIVHDEGRQVVGRVSLLDGRRKEGVKDSSCQNGREEQTLLLDDYVLPTEPVVDYVTRFSGLVEEDLNPATSRHAVVSDRTAYLKLRYYRDSGCIFVGHGLQKDFETANIFVPPEQIRDTVELWRLPNMRKISLRFLASYLLHMEIQDDIHDSIEDARTALILYRHYEDTLSAGETRLQ
ncbi:PAN2, partial [Symbiodinium microadriaticum]